MKHAHGDYAIKVNDSQDLHVVANLLTMLGYEREILTSEHFPKCILTHGVDRLKPKFFGFNRTNPPDGKTLISIRQLFEMVEKHKIYLSYEGKKEWLRQSKLKNFYELTDEPTDICITDGATQYIQGVSNPERKGWLKNGKFWNNSAWIMHSDRPDEYTVLWDRSKDIILPITTNVNDESKSLSLQQVFEALANGVELQFHTSHHKKGCWIDLDKCGLSLANIIKPNVREDGVLTFRIKPDFALLNDVKVDKPAKIVTDAITGSVGLVYGDLGVAEKNKKLLENLFGM